MIILRQKPLNRKTSNRVSNKKGSEPQKLYLYDEIGFWGVDAQSFVEELNSIDADTIDLHINSPGGDVFAAKAMQTALMQHKARVVVHIDGLAASAASVVAMAGDEVEMVDGGFLMIHKALSFFDIFGYFNDENLEELSEQIDKERKLLGKVDDSIANEYAKRTGQKIDDIKQKMSDETWFTAKEAKDFGLINKIYDGEPVENKFNLSNYSKTPEPLRVAEDMPTKREVERALRDAGCSAKLAKSILANVSELDGDQRDVDPDGDGSVQVNLRDVDEPGTPLVLDDADALSLKIKKYLKGELDDEDENVLSGEDKAAA